MAGGMSALWPIAIGLLLCIVRVPVEAIERATPEEVSLRSDVLQGIHTDLQELVRKHIVPGGIVKITRHGKLVFESTVGYPSDDMIFRLFSMSKPVTAAAVCLLVQDGLIELDDPVGKHIPELANLEVIKGQHARPGWYDTEPPKTLPTVRNLLTHTAGFTYGHGNTTVDAMYRRANLITYLNKGETLAELIETVARIPLLYHPGEHWWYSLSFDIAGYLIEKVTGKPVDVYMRERLFDPLGMVDTGFYVPPEKAHRLSQWVMMSGDPESASRSFPDWNMIGNNFLEDPTLKLAGGGLVSTANDFLRFAQMLLNGGTLDGKRLLREDLVEQLVTNQLPKHLMPYRMLGVTYYNQGHTLGSASQLLDTDEGPAGEVTWGGQANTKWFISRKYDTVIIAMTQKSPFPFQVADVARHYLYRSATDIPAPRNDTNLVDDKGERIDMWEVLPHGRFFNPHWQDASDVVKSMAGTEESDAQPRVRSYARA